MPGPGPANERTSLVDMLDRLFAGPRENRVTIAQLLHDMHGRGYPLVIAVLDIPNCVPTGIPWLSTITGVPIVILLSQMLLGHDAPSLPAFIGNRAMQRGRLQDFMLRARRWIGRLESAVHPRYGRWTTGTAGFCLSLALMLNALVLALPIPFDNFLPAWAVMFFSLALLERDGLMALTGWLTTLAAAAWTVVLLFFYSELAGLLPLFWRQLRDALFS
ncbi:MAG: exopolysaccharide biosynthesis protein [Alphaproteobacteria bacterium]|nr:exopolysaccharide biosynthesis protein [Alphaproteobacteria bacterium]